MTAIGPHLPVLQVVLPLLAAPFCAILRKGDLAWLLACLVALGALAISIQLLGTVLATGPISYALGGWAPPWGIEYRVDAANALVLLIVSGIASVALPYARTSIAKEVPEESRALFYTAFLLCLTGLLGVTITGDAFNVFVFLEISSLSTYVLVAMGAGRDPRALSAALTYLIMGTIGATFFVIGIGLLYMVTGTLNMVDLAVRIEDLGASRTVRAGFAFVIVGLGVKLALFPLHQWLPNAYTYAPSAVTVFLSATSTKVAVYVLLRFLFSVFGLDYPFEELTLRTIFLPLALIGMFAASIVAVFQVDIKRMLAYSSVAQIGYMMLGIAIASPTGLIATLVHLFNHAVTKGALFMAIGCFVLRAGSARIDDLAGLGRHMPWTAAVFVIGGLSLIGVPLTVGFVSKWYLVQAAFELDAWWLALLVVASSLIAVIYVWRVVEALYLREPLHGEVAEAPASMLVPAWLLMLAAVYFGIDASFTYTVASTAVAGLLPEGTPLIDTLFGGRAR